MHGQLFIAGRNRATLLQPANTAFGHIAPTIASDVVADRSSPSLAAGCAAWRNDCAHAVGADPLTNALGVIGPVRPNPSRPLARSSASPMHPSARRQRFKVRCFMGLPRCQQRGQRHPRSIHQQMEFRAVPPFGSTKRVVRRFIYRPPFLGAPAAERLARMEELSTHHWSQSSWSQASRRSRSARSRQ